MCIRDSGKRALGMLIAWWGRREEARDLLESAFETQRRTRGDDDPQLTTVIRMDLGRVLRRRGQIVKSERHLQSATKDWNTSRQTTINVCIKLGRLNTSHGR